MKSMKTHGNPAQVTYFSWYMVFVSLLTMLVMSACSISEPNYNDKGNELFYDSSFDEAIARYHQAQDDEPYAPEPHYNAANAHNRLNRLEDVQAETDQALDTAEPELASNTWYNLGNAFFDSRQWAQSIEAYQEALRLKPDDKDAKINLELALQKLKEQQEEEKEQEQESEEQNQDQNQDSQQEDEQDQSSSEETDESQEQEQEEPTETQADLQFEGMTEEQAAQLLKALLGDSRTLQEQLQQAHEAPDPPPQQDW